MAEGHTINPTDVHRASGTLHALMASAKMADELLDGRLREDFLTLTRVILHDMGALGVGTAPESDDEPRTIFKDGKMITPDGTEWSIG